MSRILIVEDEADIALGLEDDLTIDGHQVEVARDGEAGCRRGRDHRRDMILLDVMQPKKHGFASCERGSKRFSGVSLHLTRTASAMWKLTSLARKCAVRGPRLT